MTALLSFRRGKTWCRLILSGGVALLSACASKPASGPRTFYRVSWTATRASDHIVLASASTIVATGQSATVRTSSTRPLDNQPALPRFAAELSRTKTPGVLELVSRASVLETRHNKKGKLRIKKRTIGALVPIRSGEAQLVSSADDPVHLEVRLERR